MWNLIGVFHISFTTPLFVPYASLGINLITGANTLLVTVDWKNRVYEKYSCVPQGPFSCQKLSGASVPVWACLCLWEDISASCGQSMMQQHLFPYCALCCCLPSWPQKATPAWAGVLLLQPNFIFTWWGGVWQVSAACVLPIWCKDTHSKKQYWGFL